MTQIEKILNLINQLSENELRELYSYIKSQYAIGNENENS